MNKRIIARLDIKGPNLVKGIHLEGLRVLGKPEEFAEYYYRQGADELMYQDVVASLYGRNSLHEIISRTAKQNFIPLTVGGGLRSIDDIRKVLRSGADKVALNTAAIKRPQLIREAARMFGSSTVVVAIEAIRQPDGRYLAYTDNGREHTGVEVTAWAQKAEELGAGEIALTSVDREGTGTGFDMELITTVAERLSIPVIVHGGAGTTEHLCTVLRVPDVDAVAISSIVHYDFVHRLASKEHHEQEGNVDFLKSGGTFSKVVPASLPEIKRSLLEAGIRCRP